jgi:regulator of protease activity HflC (stomatin/prohibitin superfamily)
MIDALVIFGTLVFITILVALIFKRTIIFEHERGLKYSKGKFAGILMPGRYFHTFDTTIQRLDIRLRTITVGGQEVLSADGVSLKLSLVGQYEIADPNIAIHKVEFFQQALYIELQSTLREIVSSLKIDEVIAQRREIAAKLFELSEKRIAEIGLRLVWVNVKDIMFAGEFKKIFSQVVQARQEGLAALEKARGETAALRSLANAAKMIDSNPALMQLRFLQAFGETSGNSMILKLSQAAPDLRIKANGKETREESAR